MADLKKLLIFANQKIMRKYLLFLPFALMLSACGSGDSSSTEEVTEALPEILAQRTTKLDLSEYQLPFVLIVPDSTRGIPEVVVTSFGETDISVGSAFHVVIAEGGDVAEKTKALSEDLMYTNTIIEQAEDFLLYKSEIKDSFLDPEFHFYAVKNVNGISYEFRDYSDEGGYAETVARFMLTSINHLKAKN